MVSDGLDHLSGRDFQRLARFIQDYSGIKMPVTKKTMVEGRLRKRVGAGGFASFNEYCRHLFDDGGMDAECLALIDAVTTNKTEFFREPEHFRILAERAVPSLLAERRAGASPLIKVWSTASSIGAEPYTLAMVLADESRRGTKFRFSILGTDISTRVLKTASSGIYPEEMIAPVPMDLRKRYLLRSKNDSRGLVRIVPELRRMVQFGRLNLMDESYPVDRGLDVIFCRNLLIYFDKPTQQAVLTRLCDHLRPGGYLFLGHSETLAGFGLPLQSIGTTVFRRD
ncbi:MAG: protein-glutamate O-methyltransferase [Alphaproteobacteria bacterium]|nr:protein-glutamate O-methyltransferase [Alphaproteobacteria bacterium]